MTDKTCQACETGDLSQHTCNLGQLYALDAIGWDDYIEITRQWLEHYPPDIFTGISGDPGVKFILGVRNALAALDAER